MFWALQTLQSFWSSFSDGLTVVQLFFSREEEGLVLTITVKDYYASTYPLVSFFFFWKKYKFRLCILTIKFSVKSSIVHTYSSIPPYRKNNGLPSYSSISHLQKNITIKLTNHVHFGFRLKKTFLKKKKPSIIHEILRSWFAQAH